MKKIALLFCALLVTIPAAAQTWTGAGGGGNWSIGSNWTGGVAPASSPTTQLTFPNSAPGARPVVDAPWTINRLDLQGTYFIDGQPLTFDGAGARITVGGVDGINNAIVLAAPLSIGGGVGFISLGGTISGPGLLTVAANGFVLLNGTSTSAAGVAVTSGGILSVNGTVAGPVTVTAGGVLEGSGTINGPVTVSGANATVQLSTNTLSTGAFTLGAGSLLTVEMFSNVGAVRVTGTVDLTGAALNLIGGYVPQPSDFFTIIVNDGVDPVVGTFAGLPEGAAVTFNGVPLYISYRGGTGNDVTLSAALPAGPVQVPTLSEWGLMLLAALLAGIAMLHPTLRRLRKGD